MRRKQFYVAFVIGIARVNDDFGIDFSGDVSHRLQLILHQRTRNRNILILCRKIYDRYIGEKNI